MTIFESRFLDRKPFKRPTCPFCGMPVDRPKELSTRMQGEMPVGACACGAVYACDETGHSVGTAMIESLVFGCNMDWDLAWGLTPGDDYLEDIVEHYDLVTHLVIPGGVYQGRRISGVLYFVRFHQDVRDVTEQGVRNKLEASPPKRRPAPPGSAPKGLSKKEVEDLVGAYQPEPILARAQTDRKLIRNLQRLLYSGDDQFRMRAADILGMVSSRIAETDPGAISKLLQRLFTAITDTAAFTWGALEAIGEIIRYKPALFGGYVPRLYQFLFDETRRAQALQTIAKVAEASPALLRKHTLYFITYLHDPDPRVRAYAAWLMGNLGAGETKEDLKTMCDDAHEIPVYGQGELKQRTVGEMALEALAKF